MVTYVKSKCKTEHYWSKPWGKHEMWKPVSQTCFKSSAIDHYFNTEWFPIESIHKIPEHNKKYILKCLWVVASNITAGKRMSFTTTLTTTTKYHGLQGDEVFQLLLWEGRGAASVAPTDTLKYPELNQNLAKYWSCVPLHLRHWSLSDLWDHIISRTGGPSSLSLILHHPHCLKQPK